MPRKLIFTYLEPGDGGPAAGVQPGVGDVTGGQREQAERGQGGHEPLQYSTVQYSTVQYSTVPAPGATH